ncbi:MAG: HD domain-containing protein [Patescibacteria group bacterium]|nr:HD domain-containing protein [Patescibacteria group bacterium]
MKLKLRYATTRDETVHNESVAEHKFAALYLAYYFLPLEDPRRLMCWETVNLILLFHDFPELKHGDFPYHLKTREDEERERRAAPEVFASLPAAIGRAGYVYWREYEKGVTREARFAQAVDKIEPLFELLGRVQAHSIKRLRFTYEQHMGKKLAATEGFPYMRRFVEVMSADMLARGDFWTPENE